MTVSRATWALVAMLVSGCRESASPGRPSAVGPMMDVGVVRDVPAAPSSPSRLDQALAMGFPDGPVSVGEIDRWMGDSRTDDSLEVHRAWLGAAVRRAPSSRLGTIWASVPPNDLPAVLRWFAGRSRESGTAVLPPSLRQPTEAPSLDAATAIARLRPEVSLTAPQDGRIADPSLDEQLAAARLLSIPSVPLPDQQVLLALGPWVWPAIARSLSARENVPTPTWAWALHTMAGRCRAAPRLWCNAWRAVRDAAADNAEIKPELLIALGEANPTGLPPAVASTLRCENATVADRGAAAPLATLRCATPGFEWIGSAAQAGVWGTSVSPPGVRARALEVIRASANGQVEVLEAVAKAASNLPVGSGTALLRTLARERDPGVMASLLEGLVLHVQQARALGEAERRQLEAAPFTLPEGPSLEARLHAITLARTLRDPDPGTPSDVRAIQAAGYPDAGIAPRTSHPPTVAPPTRVRITTTVGTADIELDPRAAPLAVDQVVRAARGHRYDGLVFHRVVPGYVVQGFDPRGDGYGGTEETVPTELSIRHFERGAVGIPLAGLDTGGIQLFVVLADAPHLDGRYPWVGRVVRGMDVIDGILPQDRVIRVEILDP